MRKAVVDLGSTRPIWSIPRDAVNDIREAFGREWEVVEVEGEESCVGLGEELHDRTVTAASQCEVYFGWGVPEDVVRRAGTSLRWVHTAAAGVAGSLTPSLRSSQVQFTNSRGIHSEPVADWVLAAICFCARGFHMASVGLREKRWVAEQFTVRETPLRELRDLRIGIVGLGGIGRAVARRCAALGMTVRAIRRHVEIEAPEYVVWVGGTGDLPRLASESDMLVIAAPHTAETVNLIDHSVLDRLPAGAFVLNVARGSLLDEDALLSHLGSGRLGGCVLDVFQTEPLPSEHPFWEHPRVFLTPHVSGVTPEFWLREKSLISANIARYLRGEELHNVVDFEAGY